MKKLLAVILAAFILCAMLQGCGSKAQPEDNAPSPETSEAPEVSASEDGITEEMAYEGVSNYCHDVYDWSAAEDDPSMMYVEMGEESETEYQVIFRSYTGSFVYFYVDKADGVTRMTEYVPALDIENEAGSFSLYDYLEKQN